MYMRRHQRRDAQRRSKACAIIISTGRYRCAGDPNHSPNRLTAHRRSPASSLFSLPPRSKGVGVFSFAGTCVRLPGAEDNSMQETEVGHVTCSAASREATCGSVQSASLRSWAETQTGLYNPIGKVARSNEGYC